MDGQGTKRRTNSAENFTRLSRTHERYRRQTDGRQHIANVSSRSLKMVLRDTTRWLVAYLSVYRIWNAYSYDNPLIQNTPITKSLLEANICIFIFLA